MKGEDKLKSIFCGKRLSVLGDSISTLEGYSNNSAYNKTLVCNEWFYSSSFAVELTYWYQLIAKYGFKLCVNNSWSGAYLTKHAPNVGNDTSAALSPGVERVKYLADSDGVSPDYILIFMGINDLGGGVSETAFAQAYEEVMAQIRRLYVGATVICLGIPNFWNAKKEKIQAYNDEIKRIVSRNQSALYVNLYREDEDEYCPYTLDGLHPNARGMTFIFEEIEKSLYAELAICKKDAPMHRMRLREKPFEAIKNGSKTIELRLFDEKRRRIKVGDNIQFQLEGEEEFVTVQVKKLHLFRTFQELFDNLHFREIVGDNLCITDADDMDAFYSKEEQEEYGVVGIEIELI